MIKFANQVPSVYSSASRDFQYLGWLIDIVLNSVKHNVDDIYSLPNTSADPKYTELLATTLGFKIKRNYDQAQLSALIAVLPRILKYKGTKLAVDIAGQALLSASGASGDYRSKIVDNELQVTFPETLVDVTLFNDLLMYILPAGITCRIKRTNIVEAGLQTEFNYNEQVMAKWLPDIEWDGTKHTARGLAGMFIDTPTEQPIFANYKTDFAPNYGLLNNSIIPILDNTLVGPQLVKPDYTEEQNDYGTTAILNNYAVEENDDDGSTVIIGGDQSQ